MREYLDGRGMRVRGEGTMRLVTHLDVDASAVDRVVSAFAAFFQKAAAHAAD